MPTRPFRHKDLRAVNEGTGYTPGRLRLERLAEDEKRLREMLDCLKYDIPWPENPQLNFNELRELIMVEAREFEEREGKVLNFFYPTMQAITAEVTDGAPKAVGSDPLSDDEWEEKYGTGDG